MFRIVGRRLLATACFGLLAVCCLALCGCGESRPQEVWTRVQFAGADVEYTPTIAETDVDRLLQYLSADGFLDGSTKSLRLAKTDAGYELHIPVSEGFEQEPDYLEVCKLLCVQLSVEVFADKPVSLRLCDANLKSLATVTAGEWNGRSFDGGTLVYGPNIPEATLGKIGEYLVETQFFAADTSLPIRVERIGATYEFLLINARGGELTPESRAACRDTCFHLSVDAVDFAPVTLRLCDHRGKTRETFVRLDHGRGLRFGMGAVFPAPGIDEALAKRLGEYMLAAKIFGRTDRMAVELSRRDGTYELRYPTHGGFERDPLALDSHQLFAVELSAQVFDGHPVSLKLCDKHWEDIATVVAGDLKAIARRRRVRYKDCIRCGSVKSPNEKRSRCSARRQRWRRGPRKSLRNIL